jgi:hypothetical protein
VCSKYVAMKMKFFSGFPKHFLSKTYFTEYWIDYSFDLLSLFLISFKQASVVYVFVVLTRPTIFRTRGEHANHYASDAVYYLWTETKVHNGYTTHSKFDSTFNFFQTSKCCLRFCRVKIQHTCYVFGKFR